MLFRNLFIATLAALALVGCNDDNDIIEPTPAEANDVNVVFAAASGFEMRTKAGEGDTKSPEYSGKYKTVESTENVQEYCVKTQVSDREFVINDLTVFAFDSNSGALVKTSYFSDGNKYTKEATSDVNSINEFGGIILKAGTYNFILAGNLEKDQLELGSGEKDFDKYKNATIGVGRLEKVEGNDPYLPMIKVLENITLSAQKVSASATLNLIGDDDVKTIAEANNDGSANQASVENVSNAILLKRLVARVQLRSLTFNWEVPDADVTLTLNNIYLVNASKETKLMDDTDGVGYAYGGGIWKSDEMLNYNIQEAVCVNSYTMPAEEFEALEKTKFWGDPEDLSTDKSDYYFYAFPRVGVNEEDKGTHDNWEVMFVLECSLTKGEQSNTVYYYTPFAKGENAGIVANKVYNMNITIKGDGSDTPGKEKEKQDVTINYVVDNWDHYYIQTEDGKPTPVPNY